MRMVASKTGLVTALAVTCLNISIGLADDCPTSKTASNSFIVERGERTKLEVFRSSDTETRTVLRYDGRTLTEVTLFQGLFELDRLDRGKRKTYRPISNLAKAYPPVPGKKLTALLEETDGDRKTTRSYVLDVRKEVDTLAVGACKYAVVLIDWNVLSDKSKPVFLYTDYYAPDLKLILAKEYRERDGSKTLNKFDNIYPSAR